MTTVDLPRFRSRQQPRPTLASTRRDPVNNRQLLLLVLFLQGASLTVLIAGVAFISFMFGELAAPPTGTVQVRPAQPQFQMAKR